MSSDDGVAMIPAPPSLDAECENPNDTTENVGPSRESVYAAIATVRANKTANSGALRPEELILQKLPVSTHQVSPSNTSLKENTESGNVARIISQIEETIDLTVKEGILKDVPPSDSLPETPSLEQASEEQIHDDPSTAAESAIPAPPSFETTDKETDNSSNTVNSILGRLGVVNAAPKDSVNLSSAESTDHTESRSGSAALEVQPESVEEIAAIIDAVREQHLAREASKEQSDPIGASTSESDANSYHGDDENPFVDYFLSEKSFESDSVDDEKKVDDGSTEFKTRFGAESFAADIRKTLSTVQEVGSVDVEDDESNTDAVNRDNALSSLEQDKDNVPHAASGEHESVYGDDGRKEPKGVYEKAKVDVEEKMNDLASIGGYSDNGWSIRDVASEETLQATGRRRPQVILSGKRPSQKSKNAVSLFDEISQQPSETLSEFRMGLSFGSDDFDDYEPNTIEDKETKTNHNLVIETSDSVEEDNRCMIDAFLYNRYEPENELPLRGGDQKDKTLLLNTGEVRTTQQLLGIEVSDVYVPKYIPNDSSTDDLKVEEPKTETTSASAETTEDTPVEDQDTGEESNPFLRQFEALGLEDDEEEVAPENDPVAKVPVDPDPDVVLKSEEDPVKDDAEDPVEGDVEEPVQPVEDLVIDPSDDMSPEVLKKYFENIDRLNAGGEKEEKLRKELKSLMAPAINGKIPSILDEARIRTAALKADISLHFVDTFLDFVKDHKFEVSEPEVSCKTVEETQKADETEKQTEEELEEASEPPLVSATESESQEKSGLNNIEDSGDDSTADENESEEEFDDKGAEDEIDGVDESNGSDDVINETLIDTPKDHESINSKPDPIAEEMLRACKRIEEYDEWVWYRRAAMATHGWDRESKRWQSSQTSPQALSYTPRGAFRSWATSRDVSNYMFNERSFPLSRKYCKLSRKRRVKGHAGYLNVDLFSLQEAATSGKGVNKSMNEMSWEELRNAGQRFLNDSLQESATSGKENKSIDETPWELRNVRQGFLHERSLTFSRNWFCVVETSGNDKVKAPICKPRSMEMPMRNIPDPGDWTPEWYTPWGGRKVRERRPSLDSSVDSLGDSYTERRHNDDDDSRGSYSSADSSYSDDEWEDAPECGTFVNTKLKIGEPVSRVHPDYTSSLRNSRWRDKYFEKGSLP